MQIQVYDQDKSSDLSTKSCYDRPSIQKKSKKRSIEIQKLIANSRLAHICTYVTCMNGNQKNSAVDSQ